MNFCKALLELFNRHFLAAPRTLRRRGFRIKLDDVPGSTQVDTIGLDLQENDGVPIVNYMWLNDVPEDQSAYRPSCSIPLEKMASAIENANRYPQAWFKFWIDGALVGQETRFWLASHLYATAKHANIEICDLRSIPQYANDPLFAPENCRRMTFSRGDFGSVYLRSDAARVVVLNHCLAAHRHQSRFILYSDLDCPDLYLDYGINVMRGYGVVINDLGHDNCVSHGYIGLDCDHSFVGHNLAKLADYTIGYAKQGALGDHAFDAFLKAMHGDYMADVPIRVMVLPHICYQPPHNNFFRSLGVN